MKKLLDLPEITVDKLKKKALKAKSRSVKQYMENVLIKDSNDK